MRGIFASGVRQRVGVSGRSGCSDSSGVVGRGSGVRDGGGGVRDGGGVAGGRAPRGDTGRSLTGVVGRSLTGVAGRRGESLNTSSDGIGRPPLSGDGARAMTGTGACGVTGRGGTRLASGLSRPARIACMLCGLGNGRPCSTLGSGRGLLRPVCGEKGVTRTGVIPAVRTSCGAVLLSGSSSRFSQRRSLSGVGGAGSGRPFSGVSILRRCPMRDGDPSSMSSSARFRRLSLLLSGVAGRLRVGLLSLIHISEPTRRS